MSLFDWIVVVWFLANGISNFILGHQNSLLKKQNESLKKIANKDREDYNLLIKRDSLFK
ncbi:hypothetical protein CPR19088_GLDEOEPO_01360 [Companilactobacillus paralimentarius]